MRIWIEVRNFAKIEYARVCVNKYTVFVGPNNSGKTFLLQLIEGVNDSWKDLIDEKATKCLFLQRNEQLSIYEISEETLPKFVECVNDNIKRVSDDIIFSTFGKQIEISELKVDISLDKGERYIIYNSDNNLVINELLGGKENGINNWGEDANISVIKSRKINDATEKEKLVGVSASFSKDENIWNHIRRAVSTILSDDSIFIPASRNGLMLLYREFFAHKTDSVMSYKFSGENISQQIQESLNLTKYMYEFLKFLQLYKEDDGLVDINEDVISFFDDKIINGEILIDQKNGMTYSSQGDNNHFPMYLTSAMVNEVVPFYLAMTSNRFYRRFVIDEIEASLHPQKQLEMVRFLNRLRNKNYQIILTTHSDTFVNRLNNLVILSNYFMRTGDKTALERLNLEEFDLIDVSELFVYEFVNGVNGKSIVEEKICDPNLGYQFDLFTSAALEVYNEAFKVGEIIKDE